MKKVTAMLLAASMVLSLAGCSQKAKEAPAGTGSGNSAAATEAPAADRKVKDEIVFAQSSDLTTMNPYIGTQERAYSLTNHMYDTLLVYDSEMNMSCSLAESYEWVDDLTLQINLVHDVKFQIGRAHV